MWGLGQVSHQRERKPQSSTNQRPIRLLLLLISAHHAELPKLAPVGLVAVHPRLLEVDALAIVAGVGGRLVDAVDQGHLGAALGRGAGERAEQQREGERDEEVEAEGHPVEGLEKALR